jgi:hypothetical protein
MLKGCMRTIHILFLVFFGTACMHGQRQNTPPKVGVEATTVVESPSVQAEREINGEPSKYGKFVLEERKDGDCEVVYLSSIEKQLTTALFLSPCSDDKIGEPVYAPNRMGKVEFPYLAPNGDEFHLFRERYCGSGGCGASYWAVVINGEKLWVTKESFGGDLREPEIEDAKIVERNGKAIVSFTRPATTIFEGGVYEVSMGRVETTVLKKKPRSVASKKNVVLIGTWQKGANFSNDLPYIDDGNKDHIIQDLGICAQDEPEFDTKIQMTAELKTWSDGATDLTCVSIKFLE